MIKNNDRSKNLNNYKNKNLLLISGLVSSIIFTSLWIIQGMFASGYNPLKHPVSSLIFTPFGWIQSINFLITGALLIIFAVSLAKLKESENLPFSGILLIAICGIAWIFVGIFPTDPLNNFPIGTPILNIFPTFHGFLHSIFANIFFYGIALSSIIFAVKFSKNNSLKIKNSKNRSWLSILSYILGILVALFFTLTNLGFAQLFGLGNFPGLFQRIALISGFSWIGIISLYFFLYKLNKDFV